MLLSEWHLPGVADVGVIVNCGSTHIPSHLIFVEVPRHKDFLRTFIEKTYSYLLFGERIDHAQLWGLTDGLD
jgi:hypothetical protein